MALIKCSECGKEISDTVESCVHCGCPLGKVIFNTGNSWIGVFGKYIITDESGNVLAKLKENQQFEMNIVEDTTFYVQCNTSIRRNKVKVCVPAGEINKFLVKLGFLGIVTVVSKID